MSGGSHGYICYRIEDELVGAMHDKELNDLMKDIAELAHDVEWYDSGDYGDETYKECVKKFKRKWFKQSREERLKDYINTAIEELKQELIELVEPIEEVTNEIPNN